LERRRILQELQVDGRLTSVELARRIGLSTSATHTRIRQLEQEGFVDRYVALLNWERAGYDMVCFVNVSLQMHQPERVEASSTICSRWLSAIARTWNDSSCTG